MKTIFSFKPIGMFLICFLAFTVAAYSFYAYAFKPLGALTHPEIARSFLLHKTGIYLHIFSSILALSLGPFQFSTKLRKAKPAIHRFIGRIYLAIGVALGGLSGLYMSQFAYGGLVAKLGFAGLAIAWLISGLKAYSAIRSGNVIAHRQWMIRNFALTFAAVTLRLYIPISMALAIPYELAYPFIAWLCWIPNLLVAELIVNKVTLKHKSG